MSNSIFQAFSKRSFLYLWIGEVFTQISINFFNFFLIFLVFSLTRSSTAVSWAVVTFTVPAIILGIFAGAYVDRWNKKRVLVVSNIMRAVMLLLLAFTHSNLIAIYTLSFFISVASQFFIPAETPIIPVIVGEKLLLSANALFGLGLYGSIFLAYVMSGPVIGYFGFRSTLIILSFMMFLGSLFISLIRLEKESHSKNIRISLLHEVRHGISIMAKSKVISDSLFLLALSQVLILVFSVIAPGYATQVLHLSVKFFPTYFVTPAAIGVVFGAVIIVSVFHSVPKTRLIKIGLFLSSAAMIALPYGGLLTSREVVRDINGYLPGLLDITKLHIVVVIAFFLGLANALVFVPANTMLQESTTDDVRGRVYGVLNSLVGLLSFIPVIIVGSLADYIGVDKVITGIGIVLLCIATVHTLRSRDV